MSDPTGAPAPTTRNTLMSVSAPPMFHSVRGLRATAVLAATLVLSACTATGGNPTENPEPGSTTRDENTSVTVTTPASSVLASESGSSTPVTSSSRTTTSPERSPRKLPRSVQEAYEHFGSLAPRSLFEKFDSCMPNGVADSSACSGEEVGQFQFFDNDSKAASTTQLLTELRSARIVQDDGDVIVGWSSIGTVAIITVVDNARGVVLQQMISTDEQDPRERILELGLARRPTTTTSAPSVTASTETGESSPVPATSRVSD
ncbi:hypothetical protein [Corynebacterium sp. CCM 9203]|uniref:hypothetical protein n=1 Tax=Corynebacterium sp. CCM 9203 TaxID=3057615 RepID=UPI0035252834